MLAVVLTFDHFPLRLLGGYGNFSVEAPCLDQIAAESVVFDQHFGEDFSSPPEGHAWWTGCYHFPRKGTGLLSEVPTLEGLLSDGNVEARWLMDTAGGSVPLAVPATEVNSLARLIEEGNDQLRKWSHNREARRLLWLKAGGLAWSLETFQERSATADPEELYQELMTEALERFDEALEPLWETIRGFEAGPVLFLLTAARGFSLGERESQPLWAEEFVHLPLIIWQSEHPGGERRSELTQSIDLPATLLDFLEIEVPSSFEGQSLLPMFRGEDLEWRNALTYGESGSWDALRTPDYHFVRMAASEGSPEPDRRLFIKPDDVWDWHDVSSQEPELTELFSQKMDAFFDSARTRLPVPEPIDKLLAEPTGDHQSEF